MTISKYIKLVTWLFCMFVLCVACKENRHEEWSETRTKMELKGQEYLQNSRQALSEKKFGKARQYVIQLRKSCELALSAREEGILLMDSIDFFEAKEQLRVTYSNMAEKDSNLVSIEELQQKISFFQRKLEHDKKEYCVK